jgi:hypothetical protein
MAFVSFRKVRGLMVFFPFLKCRIAHSAVLDWWLAQTGVAV